MLLVSETLGSPVIAQRLLQAGANVDLPDAYGNTPLLIASYYGHTQFLSLLLAHGAEITARNDEGDTALSVAHSKETREIFRRELVNQNSAPQHAGAARRLKSLC